MVVKAKQFQSVLDVVKKWHDQGFRDRLVNGQFALVDTEVYILKYTSKAGALNYGARSSTPSAFIRVFVLDQWQSSTCIEEVD